MERLDNGRPERLAVKVGEGMLDPELAALAWLLVGSNVPVVVTAATMTEANDLREALLGLRPPAADVVVLAGSDESFAWMPEAAELGWTEDEITDGEANVRGGGRMGDASASRGEGAATPGERPRPVLMVADLDAGGGVADAWSPRPTWGERARVAIRAVSIGYGMLATIRASRLEDMLASLAAAPVGALDDELTGLGLVLILAATDDGLTRVVAAHYLRPVSRDAEGHIHRFAPAVVATWDSGTRRVEHFAWAITDELAGRAGMTTTELEREVVRRAGVLSAMAAKPR
jgi:hypothetical protein